MPSIDVDVLARIIRRNGVTAFQQFSDALPLELLSQFSGRGINSRIDAGLRAVLRDRPTEFATSRCRARLLSRDEVGVLWDSTIHVGPMPIDKIADTLVEQWQLMAPDGDVDLYFPIGHYGLTRDFVVSGPDRISARLMLTTEMQSRFRSEEIDERRWERLPSHDIAASYDGRPACRRVNAYVPLVEGWSNAHTRTTRLVESLQAIQLHITVSHEGVQIIAPRMPNTLWPTFDRSEDTQFGE